jgi:hypothetical protein
MIRNDGNTCDSLYCELYVRYLLTLYDSWAERNREWIARMERSLEERMWGCMDPFPPPSAEHEKQGPCGRSLQDHAHHLGEVPGYEGLFQEIDSLP